MRPVTLDLSKIQDPAVSAALMQIQNASNDTLQNDGSSSGTAIATTTGATLGSGGPEIPYYSAQYTVAFAPFPTFSQGLIGQNSAANWLTALGFSTFSAGLVGDTTAVAWLGDLGFSTFSQTLPALTTAAAWRTALGTGTGAGTVTSVATGAGLSGGTIMASGTLTVDPSYLHGYIGGLTLSNDVGSATTVLDIAAGVCVDSTNAVLFKLGAFTKSTGGSWAAGSGSNGMGTGLTIANTTWYHVFAIVNGGNSDVYFDTSLTAAHAPSGTTAFRRIGSFLTDGSAHIIAFSQNGEEFLWSVPVLNINNTAPGNTTANSKAVTAPLGIKTTAIVWFANTSGATAFFAWVSSLDTTDETPTSTTYFNAGGADATNTAQLNVRTDTSSQIRYRISANAALTLGTIGWIDTRGRFS